MIIIGFGTDFCLRVDLYSFMKCYFWFWFNLFVLLLEVYFRINFIASWNTTSTFGRRSFHYANAVCLLNSDNLIFLLSCLHAYCLEPLLKVTYVWPGCHRGDIWFIGWLTDDISIAVAAGDSSDLPLTIISILHLYVIVSVESLLNLLSLWLFTMSNSLHLDFYSIIIFVIYKCNLSEFFLPVRAIRSKDYLVLLVIAATWVTFALFLFLLLLRLNLFDTLPSKWLIR